MVATQRQPTKLKILKGTREKSRELPNEFDNIIEIPKPPKYFDNTAKEEWNK